MKTTKQRQKCYSGLAKFGKKSQFGLFGKAMTAKSNKDKIRLLRKSLKINDTFSYAHYNLALAYMSEEKYEKAIVSLKQAQKHDLYLLEDKVNQWYKITTNVNLSYCYAHLKEFAKTENYAGAAIKTRTHRESYKLEAASRLEYKSFTVKEKEYDLLKYLRNAYYYRGLARIRLKKASLGCRDLDFAVKNGLEKAKIVFGKLCQVK